MQAKLTIPMNDDASFSYRVAMRRNSLSLAMQRSTTLRFLYARLLSFGCHCSRSFTCSFSRIGITASTLRALSHRRILSELYPLSPAMRLGQCPPVLTSVDPTNGPMIGHSLRLPRVTITCSTLHFPSVYTCS